MQTRVLRCLAPIVPKRTTPKVGNMRRGEGQVQLAALKAATATLDPTHPLRLLVTSLPDKMPSVEFATLVPTFWSLAERAS